MFTNLKGSARKKKKHKTNGADETVGSDIIALGTASGTILLYSFNHADLKSQLTGGHTEKIYSLCWKNTGTSIFSAAADKKIIQWDVIKGTIIW